MGKRSDFTRNKHDFYPTPFEAAERLDRVISDERIFVEPCAGDGSLVRHLVKMGFVCSAAFDIAPASSDVREHDALLWNPTFRPNLIITNPPWTREILHPMILRFLSLAPTYLLLDADWAHTKQARPYLLHCSDIWPIGRFKWIPDSKYIGKDNSCWYRFDRGVYNTSRFHPRES